MTKRSDEKSFSLMRFLAEEIDQRQYADLLLERAEAAGQGKPAPIASFNLFDVSFGTEEVVIKHRYAEDWIPVRLSRIDFIATLRRWRADLKS